MNILAHIHFRDSFNNGAPITQKDFNQPPTVIKIKNFEPLRLAKKKHYQPPATAPVPHTVEIDPPYKISKKTRSSSRSTRSSRSSRSSSRSTRSSRSSRSSSRSSSISSVSSASSLSSVESFGPVTKAQGRPFNDSLNARFLYFHTIDDMISELLNNKAELLTLITDFGSFKAGGFSQENSMQLNVRIPEEPCYQLRQIEFDKDDDDDESPAIYPELCHAFHTKDLSFVKIIRNNKGKLVKFEVLSDLKNEDLSVNYIKKFITYPRYKAKMKIYLIRGRFDKNIWFYNDMRMLIWDLENVYLGDKKILINNQIFKDEHNR